MMGAGSFLQQVDLDSVSLDGKPGQQEWAEGLAWVKEGGTGVAQNLGREGRALRPVNPQQRDKAKEGLASQALGCVRGFWDRWDTFSAGASTWALPRKG